MEKTYPIEIVRSGNVFDNVYLMKFNNTFIDYIDMNNNGLITSYSNINRKKVFDYKITLDDEDEENFVFDSDAFVREVISIDVDPKLILRRKKLSTIEDLKNYFKKLIPISQALLRVTKDFKEAHLDNCAINYSCDLDETYLNMLVEQLVFDVLFEKYKREAEKYNRNSYSDEMRKTFELCNMRLTDRINKRTERSMEREYKKAVTLKKYRLINSSRGKKYKEIITNRRFSNISLSKTNPRNEEYFNYLVDLMRKNSRPKRTRAEWLLYMFDHSMINMYYTSTKKNNIDENNYDNFIKNITVYKNEVEKLLPKEFDKQYFEKTIEYYAVECGKRVESILDLSMKLMETDIVLENQNELCKKIFSFLKYYTPRISLVVAKNDKPIFFSVDQRYFPMLFIEQKVYSDSIKEISLMDSVDKTESIFKKAYDDLRNIQLIRAKTFELFEFYAQYISYDKKNIKDFITSSYNLCEYYKKIWIKADITNNKQLKNIIKLFVEAQNLLFY